MQRHLFNILSTVSLVMCAGAVALQVLGHKSDIAIGFQPPKSDRTGAVTVNRGEIGLVWGDYSDPADLTHSFLGYHWWWRNRLGYNLSDAFSAVPVDWSYFGFTHKWLINVAPLRFFTLLFALFPIARLWRYMVNRTRPALPICLGCGYDLRATPHRCPECGAEQTKISIRPTGEA